MNERKCIPRGMAGYHLARNKSSWGRRMMRVLILYCDSKDQRMRMDNVKLGLESGVLELEFPYSPMNLRFGFAV